VGTALAAAFLLLAIALVPPFLAALAHSLVSTECNPLANVGFFPLLTLPSAFLAAAGGVLAGAGTAAAARGWELRVLTPAGSAAWLQVESLRRFLASAPPTAVDRAITAGRLGHYTAWAIALGQAQRWSQLAADVGVPGGRAHGDRSLRYAGYGPFVVAGCATTSAAPASSSGGAGTAVGAGAGGGGGGSW
jgi:hypothetical protein